MPIYDVNPTPDPMSRNKTENAFGRGDTRVMFSFEPYDDGEPPEVYLWFGHDIRFHVGEGIESLDRFIAHLKKIRTEIQENFQE